MSFVACVVMAMMSLFLAMMAGVGIAKVEVEKRPQRRRQGAAGVVLLSIVAIMLTLAALMIAVSAR